MARRARRVQLAQLRERARQVQLKPLELQPAASLALLGR
jgi:hypothetical protein